MDFKKELMKDLKTLGKYNLIYLCEEKLLSDELENICGRTIDDIMRRGFFDYIISKQEIRNNGLIIIDIDFDLAMKILKKISFYTDTCDFAANIFVSQKYFYENLKHFELKYEIDCCLYKKQKDIFFNNVKTNETEEAVFKYVDQALFD